MSGARTRWGNGIGKRWLAGVFGLALQLVGCGGQAPAAAQPLAFVPPDARWLLRVRAQAHAAVLAPAMRPLRARLAADGCVVDAVLTAREAWIAEVPGGHVIVIDTATSCASFAQVERGVWAAGLGVTPQRYDAATALPAAWASAPAAPVVLIRPARRAAEGEVRPRGHAVFGHLEVVGEQVRGALAIDLEGGQPSLVELQAWAQQAPWRGVELGLSSWAPLRTSRYAMSGWRTFTPWCSTPPIGCGRPARCSSRATPRARSRPRA